MEWWEILIITVGISLDIFAAVECQGALAAKVEKRTLTAGSLLLALWQAAALYLGTWIAHLLTVPQNKERTLLAVIEILILFGLGVRMLRKAIRKDMMFERREDHLQLQRFAKLALYHSGYTILAGLVLGGTGSNPMQMLWMIAGLTVLVVVLGMYTGYHLGFEQRTKAYAVGGVLLALAGVDVLVREFIL